MIKLIVAMTMVMLFAVSASATEVTKIGFRAYSTATSVTCRVFGQNDRFRVDSYYKLPIQGFSPDPDYSRTYLLGNKGFGNYSTVYPGHVNLTAMQFTCVNTGTSIATPVKVYLNGVETYFLTLSDNVFVLGK